MLISHDLFIPMSRDLFIPMSRDLFIPISRDLFIPMSRDIIHSLYNFYGKNITVAIEDIKIRNFTNNVTLNLFIIK